MPDYAWRGAFSNHELNALHGEGFDHPPDQTDWLRQVQQHSLGWVIARDTHGLVGFVNVAWDGGVHAFILDTVVARRVARQGIGTQLVRMASEQARQAGCIWLHVDYEPHLEAFYQESCGFRPTPAGLIWLG